MSAQFSEDITDVYHRLLGPLIFEEYAVDLAACAVAPEGGAILETACGTGIVTRHLRRRFAGRARIVATDISVGMLTYAAERLPETDGLEYRSADATALPFEDGAFDAVLCQFGVMFFPDEAAGMAEARRVLKPGGRFLFSLWDSLAQNELAGLVHDRLIEEFPDDPPGFLNVPFGVRALDEVRHMLAGAGFGDVHMSVLPRMSRAARARDAVEGLLCGSPMRVQLAERGVDDPLPLIDRMTEAVVAAYGDSPVEARMQAIRIEAVVPA